MDQFGISTSVAGKNGTVPLRIAGQSSFSSADPVQSPLIETRPVAADRALRRGVLIVDDDASIRLLLDVALRQRGFTVWKASNGEEALGLYRLHRDAIVLVLIDVRMPVLDGPHTVAALRQLEPALCFCFMSGNSGDYTLEWLLQSGAAFVFEKPFNLAEVLQTIEELTESATLARR
jgi:CheY-like chemotaxis protein